jgi:excisionase family DNA binding protein
VEANDGQAKEKGQVMDSEYDEQQLRRIMARVMAREESEEEEHANLQLPVQGQGKTDSDTPRGQVCEADMHALERHDVFPMTSRTHPDLMSVEDVARILGVSVSTVNAMAKEQRIPHQLLGPGGARLLFHERDVSAFLESVASRRRHRS